MRVSLGQPIIIENVTGAGGTIGELALEYDCSEPTIWRVLHS